MTLMSQCTFYQEVVVHFKTLKQMIKLRSGTDYVVLFLPHLSLKYSLHQLLDNINGTMPCVVISKTCK